MTSQPCHYSDAMPVNRKGQPRAEREAAIVDEAERLFLERGFHDTTVSDIAKALELTSNAVTWYFPTKDDLLSTVLQRWTERTLAQLRSQGTDIGPTALAHALEAFRPYRRVYAVVHERMHQSAAVHTWHDESRQLLTTLALPFLKQACADEDRQDTLLPILVDLVEIQLLHFQEDDRPVTWLLDTVVDGLVGQRPAGVTDAAQHSTAASPGIR